MLLGLASRLGILARAGALALGLAHSAHERLDQADEPQRPAESREVISDDKEEVARRDASQSEPNKLGRQESETCFRQVRHRRLFPTSTGPPTLLSHSFSEHCTCRSKGQEFTS